MTTAAPDKQAAPGQGAPPRHGRRLVALIAAFDDVTAVKKAAKTVRDAGYRKWDVHSPFPIHGIEKVMGVRPTKLPYVVLACGVVGMLGGLGLAWWTNAVDYPYLISGKPIFSLPANIPVIFETTILLAAFGAVFGMLIGNQLPMLYNPLFRSPTFRRATDDRFIISIMRDDRRFDAEKTRQLLDSLGALSVEEIRD